MKNRILPILFTLLCGIAANGQTTIFNVPSTDVAAEKKLTVETDFIGHFAKLSNGGFQSYGVRAMYGLRRRTEVGVNVFFTRTGSGSPAEIQPNFKTKVLDVEKYGVSATAGALAIVPLNRAAGTRTVGMLYSNVSKVVKQTGKTRLTGGYYAVVGARRSFGSRQGAIVGVEQPVKGKLTLIADWYSGKNRFGYSSAGFYYALGKKQYVSAGYNFGNSGRGNNSLAIFYGVTF